ncbi:Uncharacterised protein [Enterobacter hormaechei]|nr:hypothetical protein AN2364V1_1252 [Enterobacter cloacae]CZU87225.1 Uncharacterised protein [Enterobacter hormaechei]CAH6232069.1 hypothetical protein AN2364V1_1252 [Enterobacter cloacae]CZV41776.1 Uncharacterised protein [Enterobacter hormaechei]SAA89931.1 Uncharacterised protein [Enterobacter hormaechei]
MMKGYKYVKKNQIDPVNIIRCKTLTINRFLFEQIYVFRRRSIYSKITTFRPF